MRNAVAAVALLALTIGALAAESRYVAFFHIVGANGKYNKLPIKTTEAGVSLDECELRKQVWLDHYGPQFESAIADLQKEGKSAAFKATCERLD